MCGSASVNLQQRAIIYIIFLLLCDCKIITSGPFNKSDCCAVVRIIYITCTADLTQWLVLWWGSKGNLSYAEILRETRSLGHGCIDCNGVCVCVCNGVIEPTARFELATPCLRNRCNNHYAMLALWNYTLITQRNQLQPKITLILLLWTKNIFILRWKYAIGSAASIILITVLHSTQLNYICFDRAVSKIIPTFPRSVYNIINSSLSDGIRILIKIICSGSVRIIIYIISVIMRL